MAAAEIPRPARGKKIQAERFFEGGESYLPDLQVRADRTCPCRSVGRSGGSRLTGRRDGRELGPAGSCPGARSSRAAQMNLAVMLRLQFFNS